MDLQSLPEAAADGAAASEPNTRAPRGWLDQLLRWLRAAACADHRWLRFIHVQTVRAHFGKTRPEV